MQKSTVDSLPTSVSASETLARNRALWPVATNDGAFQKLENELAHKPGVNDPAAVAAAIGRKELGEAEMERRSEAGRKE